MLQGAAEYSQGVPDPALAQYDYSHALAPPGANGGPPGLSGVSAAAAAAAAEAAYYNNGMGSLPPMGAMGFSRQPVRLLPRIDCVTELTRRVACVKLQYHLYHPLPSTNPRHLSSTLPSRNGSHSPTTSFFLPPALHISLTQKSEASQATSAIDVKLPDEVGGYTALLPLDRPPSEGGSGGGLGWNGYRGWVYKAWKESEGRCYMLRRIEGTINRVRFTGAGRTVQKADPAAPLLAGFRLQHEAAISAVEKWTRVRHPGLVGVREAFTTRSFGDHCTCS